MSYLCEYPQFDRSIYDDFENDIKELIKDIIAKLDYNNDLGALEELLKELRNSADMLFNKYHEVFQLFTRKEGRTKSFEIIVSR